MKHFPLTLHTSLLALCLTLLTLFGWQQQSGWFKATSHSPSARAAASSATFTPTQWRSEGREIAGFSAQLSRAAAAETPTAPAGLKPAETAAWLALAERQSTTAKQARAGKPLESFYPAQYGAPFIVEGNGVRVAVKPLGGALVAATVADNQVIYRGAYPATDSRHVVTEGRSEEFLSLASAAAPREFAYEVSEMSAGTEIKLVDGAVHFTNASGQGVQIEVPWVKEPQGEKRTDVVRWELEAGDKPRLTLRLTSADLQYPLVIDPSWSATDALDATRTKHTATLLPNGKVLVAGGLGAGNTKLKSAELYDPATGMWSATGDLGVARYNHTATLLPNGKVLVAGGQGDSGLLNSAELYDPATGMWSATGDLATARYYHTATLLPNSKVLVAAGSPVGNVTTISAELYDPATGMWSATGTLDIGRTKHTATLLPNGKVLVAGGSRFGGNLKSAELYDPATGSWSLTGDLVNARYDHTATLLPNGKVLVAGGRSSNSTPVNSAELYDPATGMWSATGNLTTVRYYHTATLLPNGKVLVAGGEGNSFALQNSTELYDPAMGMWSTTGNLATARSEHTATLLPNGKVLVAAGSGSSLLGSAELYDPAVGSWSATGNLATARRFHTATLLPNGKVLVAGGLGSNIVQNSAELYDPATGMWSVTGNLVTARNRHTATLLPNGKVLVAGGEGSGATLLNSAELYDPATGMWSATVNLVTARYWHTATLLPNGKVLVAGGLGDGGSSGDTLLNSAELYDPATEMWSTTGNLATARRAHTATLLPNGKVLLVAGRGLGTMTLPFNSTELYDPATGMWSATGALATARAFHTATLLPNGKALVAGGYAGGNSLSSAELYDPATGMWGATGALVAVRNSHTATLLPNGKVLVAAGSPFGNIGGNRAELYDPATGVWTATVNLATARRQHTATLLPNGKVLVAAGDSNSGTSINSAELYDVGLGYLPDWQPVLTSATSPLLPGRRLAATGTRFKGISEASGGSTNNSSTNYPLVQLLSLVNEQSLFLPLHVDSNWSDTSFGSAAVTQMTVSSAGFPPGYALVTVSTNGIPSTAKLILVEANTNTPPTITAMGVTRTAGAAGSNSQIAEVDDREDFPSALTVRVNDAAMATVNGVTVSNLAVDDGGVVTANVVADCTATTAMFTLKVTDSGGAMATATLTVTVTPTPIPTVSAPANQSVLAGGTASFSVMTTNATSVQWQISTDGGANFTDIPLATGNTLTLNNVTAAMNGNRYRAIASNSCGTATSTSALLVVQAAGAKFDDPLVCLVGGDTGIITAFITNNGAAAINASYSATNLAPNLIGIPGSGVASVAPANFVITPTTANWTGVLQPGETVNLLFRVQFAPGLLNGTQICFDAIFVIDGNQAQQQICTILNCPVGGINPAVNAQKPASLLVFPYYTSKAATKADTRFTISNLGTQTAFIHAFFIDGASCQPTDQFLCLTAGASYAGKASETDGETTGWILALAVNQQGVPTQFNHLIGNAFVNDGEYVGAYAAEGFAARSANLAAIQGTTALLFLDGIGYDAVPNLFATEVQSPMNAPNQRVVTVGLRGDLNASAMTGAAQVGTGLVINGNESPLGSFTTWLSGSCQAIATITNTSPRVPTGMNGMIPSGQNGTLQFKIGAGVGLLMTPRTAPWRGIRALHKIGLTTSTIRLPLIPPGC